MHTTRVPPALLSACECRVVDFGGGGGGGSRRSHASPDSSCFCSLKLVLICSKSKGRVRGVKSDKHAREDSNPRPFELSGWVGSPTRRGWLPNPQRSESKALPLRHSRCSTYVVVKMWNIQYIINACKHMYDRFCELTS